MDKIWIVNHYATKMFTDQGGRHYWLARELKKAGYEPVVFCASTIHNTDQSMDLGSLHFVVKKAEDVPFVFIKAPAYHGNGISRFRNMLAFTKMWRKCVPDFIQCFGRPDLIYASSVHPFSVDAAIQQAHKLGVPCLAEFRDLWPDVLVGMGALSRCHPLTLLLAHLERKICRQADGIIFTMQGGKQYLKDKGYDRFTNLDKVYYLNNGVDLAAFDRNAEQYPTQDEDLENPELFKLVYAGSVRRSYQLDMLLDAAIIIRDQGYDKIRILCWGQGDELGRLQARVKDENITNVIFKGGVTRFQVPAIIKKSDCNLIHCEELFGWQYGVSFIKLFDYLAAGKPIISTVPMGYNILDEYACGLTAKKHNADSIASLIIGMYQKTMRERTVMGENARRAAEEYDWAKLAEKFCAIFEAV